MISRFIKLLVVSLLVCSASDSLQAVLNLPTQKKVWLCTVERIQEANQVAEVTFTRVLEESQEASQAIEVDSKEGRQKLASLLTQQPHKTIKFSEPVVFDLICVQMFPQIFTTQVRLDRDVVATLDLENAQIKFSRPDGAVGYGQMVSFSELAHKGMPKMPTRICGGVMGWIAGQGVWACTYFIAKRLVGDRLFNFDNILYRFAYNFTSLFCGFLGVFATDAGFRYNAAKTGICGELVAKLGKPAKILLKGTGKEGLICKLFGQLLQKKESCNGKKTDYLLPENNRISIFPKLIATLGVTWAYILIEVVLALVGMFKKQSEFQNKYGCSAKDVLRQDALRQVLPGNSAVVTVSDVYKKAVSDLSQGSLTLEQKQVLERLADACKAYPSDLSVSAILALGQAI